MNNETNTMEECSAHMERINRGDNEIQARTDDQLRWTCLRMLALCRKPAPATSMDSPRQMILYLSNIYDGVHAQRFDMICRGLYLMSEGRFREALDELGPVLAGRVDPEFEVLREVALQAHTTCLQQLDYDDEALEEFTALLVQKFTETREHGVADPIARLLGLAQTGRAGRLDARHLDERHPDDRHTAAIEC
jgi:hypothetical protein